MLPVYIAVSLTGILTAVMSGVIMDSISPYTVWSDELSALRGNLNCFFNLAAEMIGALITGGISYGIYMISKSAFITISVITLMLVISSVICILKGLPKTRKNIELLK